VPFVGSRNAPSFHRIRPVRDNDLDAGTVVGAVLFGGFQPGPLRNVAVLQQLLCFLAGTLFTTSLARKLGSLWNYRGWRIGPFQHQTILSPVVAARECLRPFQLRAEAKKAQSNRSAVAAEAATPAIKPYANDLVFSCHRNVAPGRRVAYGHFS